MENKSEVRNNISNENKTTMACYQDTVMSRVDAKNNEITDEPYYGNADNTDNNDESADNDADNTTQSFDDMGLKETLLRGIYGHGFESPSSIQKKSIKRVIGGNDTIAQAQSGTGENGSIRNKYPTNNQHRY